MFIEKKTPQIKIFITFKHINFLLNFEIREYNCKIIITVNNDIVCDIARNMVLRIDQHRKFGIGIAIRSSCHFLHIQRTFAMDFFVLQLHLYTAKESVFQLAEVDLFVLICLKYCCSFFADSDLKVAELIVSENLPLIHATFPAKDTRCEVTLIARHMYYTMYNTRHFMHSGYSRP